MSIASRIESIEEHIGDIYNTLELGGSDLTNTDKNIVNINSELLDRYRDYLANGTDSLWNNWDNTTAEGTDLTLNNTIQAKMKIKPQGNTEQATSETSPSPNYPSPVNNVTGDVEVKVQNGNIFDKNNANILNNIYLGETTLSSSNGGKTLYIPCKANTTYTVSKIQSARFSIATTNELPKISANIYNRTQLNSATNLTLTSDANSKYLVMFYYLSGTDTLTEQEILNSIMIVEGTTAGEYIPHQEQNYPISLGDIELCKIGDYQDYIYKENGNWYKYGAIGKVVLDGTESWVYGDSGVTGIKSVATNVTTMKSGNYLDGYCNYFKNKKTGKDANTVRFGINNTQIGFYVNESDFDSSTSFKTWLSTHNTTVYYVLSTPTTTQITDTTLINQLNALEQAYSYNEQTNISQDGDLPFILDVTALTELS